MEQYLEVNNHHLYVESHGTDSPNCVLLLHHGLGSTLSWNSQVDVLADAGYRVITYDRWGYGRSESRAEFSMPYFQDDLSDLHVLVNEFGLQDISLIGHSDGGTIGIYYAAMHPHLVKSLITIAAHIYVEEKMQEGIEAIWASFEKDRKFKKGLQRLHGDQAEMVFSNWYGGWNKPHNKNWDMSTVCKSVKCRTFVVQGLEDEHATPQHASDIAEAVPNAALWLVEGASHMLPQELPEILNKKVQSFLSDTYPRIH